MLRKPLAESRIRGAGRLGGVLAVLIAAAILSCTSEDDTPLGTEFLGDILGSRPGVVFEDTVLVTSGDTVISFFPLLDASNPLQIGRRDGYERAMVMRFNFPGSGDDLDKTVTSAELRILFEDDTVSDVIPVRFHVLSSSYSEGDSMPTLDTLGAVVDPGTGGVARTMQLFPTTYPLPTDLVQAWIRGDSTHNGIAIVYTDPINDKIIEFKSSETTDDPQIQVQFSDLSSTNYTATDDGTWVQVVTPTTNLVISDGAVRRIKLPIDLTQISDSSAIHKAEITLNIVDGSVFGANLGVVLYLPNSSDPGDPGFISGQLVSSAILDESEGTVVLPITNALLLVLSDDLPDNGFALRFESENTEVRQAEFYGGGNPALRPRVVLTYSTKAEFDP